MGVRVEGRIDLGFSAVADVLRSQIRRVGGGAAVCVYFRGQPVVDAWAGTRNPEGEPWQADTMAMSFSTTKGVTATALHVLADRGLLDYDDPVAKHWPEFAQNGKERITIRHLLTHRAGLHDIRNLVSRGERILDWEYMTRALERARPTIQPGSVPAYHGITYGWLVGEVIRRVSGRPLQEVLRDDLARPLGLDGLYIGAPADAQERAASLGKMMGALRQAENFRPIARGIRAVSRALGFPIDLSYMRDALMPREGAAIFWHPRILEAPIPAANGLFTARSLARLYATLGNGGSLDGVRLLSEETVRKATEIQTKKRDRVIVIRPMWRLGYHGAFTARGTLRHGFGHYGFGGSGAWVDPTRQLAVAMVNNRAGGTPLGDLRIVQINGAALRSATRIARVEGEIATRTAESIVA